MSTTEDKYFKAECQKCGWDLVIPVWDKNDEKTQLSATH